MTARYAQWGFWDPVALAQVLSNIIRNAVVHGDPDAPISVALRGTPLVVSVTVTNTGPAIPPEILPSIFEPFRRGAGTGQRFPSGPWTGVVPGPQTRRSPIGAPSPVESSAERGTSFTVDLPRGLVGREEHRPWTMQLIRKYHRR